MRRQTVLLIVGMAFAAVLLCGCGTAVDFGNLVKSDLGGIGTHLTAITSEGNAIQSEVAATEPSIPAIKEHADSIVSHAAAAQVLLASAAKGSASADKVAAENAAYIAKHKDDWLGPRAHTWIAIIVIAIAAFAVGMILLNCVPALAAVPALAKFAAVVGHGLTLGLAFIFRLFNKGVESAATAIAAGAKNPVAKAPALALQSQKNAVAAINTVNGAAVAA